MFFLRAELRGTVRPLAAAVNRVPNRAGRPPAGVEGATVELLNDAGDVIATTTTDRRGNYRFRDFDETGDYQVRLAETGKTLQVLISRGDQRIGGLDFQV